MFTLNLIPQIQSSNPSPKEKTLKSSLLNKPMQLNKSKQNPTKFLKDNNENKVKRKN